MPKIFEKNKKLKNKIPIRPPTRTNAFHAYADAFKTGSFFDAYTFRMVFAINLGIFNFIKSKFTFTVYVSNAVLHILFLAFSVFFFLNYSIVRFQ